VLESGADSDGDGPTDRGTETVTGPDPGKNNEPPDTGGEGGGANSTDPGGSLGGGPGSKAVQTPVKNKEKCSKRGRRAKKPEPERFCIGTPQRDSAAESWPSPMSAQSAASSLPAVPPFPEDQQRQQMHDALLADLVSKKLPREEAQRRAEEVVEFIGRLQRGERAFTEADLLSILQTASPWVDVPRGDS
jgi:hypothetical protein